MDEILKKLDERDRESIERTLAQLKEEEKKLPYTKQICEQLRWRIYGMADILFAHECINVDEYVVLAQSWKW